jgi:hypothetical protein
VPTPVITSKNIFVRLSTKNEKSILRLPVEIQLYKTDFCGSSLWLKKSNKDKTKARPTLPHPMIVVRDLLSVLLAKPIITNPSNGSKGISGIN